MKYTRLSTYDLTHGTFTELTGLVEKGLLPTFAKEPGFVDYGLCDVGNHKIVAISIWETREAAQQSASTAASWVKANMETRVRHLTTQVGELALFGRVPATV